MTYKEFKETYDRLLKRAWKLGRTPNLTEEEQNEFEALSGIADWAFEYGDKYFNTKDRTRVTECGCCD